MRPQRTSVAAIGLLVATGLLAIGIAPPPALARLRSVLTAEHAARMARVATVGHPIASGESLTGILNRYGVSREEIRALDEAGRGKLNADRLGAGSVLTLGFNADQRIVALIYDVDEESRAVVERVGFSKFAARLEKKAIETEAVGAAGTIRSSFYRDAREAGVPDPIISALVDLLGWELDFGSEVHPGDRFRVLYEQRVGEDGAVIRPGRVLAAEFAGRTATASAFLYESDGEPVYLDTEGRVLDGGLLRYPVDFTRITSAFSQSRFHPILKRQRPHLGVDFAAPAGTPVRAVGSGVVSWAAQKGAFGRHVEIDHGGGLVTTYSHLRAIQSAVRPGRRLKRGEVLGWVGQTGLAAGPHLHFAIFDRGRYVNPLTTHRVPQLAGVDRRKFERVRAALAERLPAEAVANRPAIPRPTVPEVVS